MRVIIPEIISHYLDLVLPYAEIVHGKGCVLKEDAPPEIVKMYHEILNWDEESKTA